MAYLFVSFNSHCAARDTQGPDLCRTGPEQYQTAVSGACATAWAEHLADIKEVRANRVSPHQPPALIIATGPTQGECRNT